MHPLVKRCRSMGHISFIYLDDGLFQRKELSSSGLVLQRREVSFSLLRNRYFGRHATTPMQIGEWLCLVIDIISKTFQIPDKKVSKLKGLLDSSIQDGHSSFRELAGVAGSIISVALAVGPFSRLLTRQMYFAIETRSAWDHTLRFSPGLLEKLKFWYCNIDSFNVYSLRPPLAMHTVVFSDASDVAFGGFSASLGTVVSGTWTTEDIGQSSTFRELKAIYHVLLSYYVAQLKHRDRVKIFTDNQSAARIVYIGSSKHLQSLAMGFLIFVFLTVLFSKRNGSPGHLMKKQIS